MLVCFCKFDFFLNFNLWLVFVSGIDDNLKFDYSLNANAIFGRDSKFFFIEHFLLFIRALKHVMECLVAPVS